MDMSDRFAGDIVMSPEHQPHPAAGGYQIGVPRAAVRVLAACAAAEDLNPELELCDPFARRALRELEGDIGSFSEVDLRCTAFRASIIDALARDFFARMPTALGVGVWSYVGTRGHRLHEFPWVDVDAPDVAELRRHTLPPRPGWRQVGTCLCQPTWLDAISNDPRRKLLLVLDESVLPTVPSGLMRLLDDLSMRLARGSELVLAFDDNLTLRPASPGRPGSALEVIVPEAPGGQQVARYPRLRFVDDDSYPGNLGSTIAGLNAVASYYDGVSIPALAHLRVD